MNMLRFVMEKNRLKQRVGPVLEVKLWKNDDGLQHYYCLPIAKGGMTRFRYNLFGITSVSVAIMTSVLLAQFMLQDEATLSKVITEALFMNTSIHIQLSLLAGLLR